MMYTYVWLEINGTNPYLMGSLPHTHQKVVRLDITMQKVPAVDVFNPLDHHVEQHQHGFGC
jgi:hypothetical protein